MPGAEFHFDDFGAVTIPDVDNRSFFIAEQFGQEAASPHVISNFHIDLVSMVAHNAEPYCICRSYR